MGETHTDLPTVALIHVWLFVLSLIAFAVRTVSCLKCVWQAVRLISPWLSLSYDRVSHVRPESPLDNGCTIRVNQKKKRSSKIERTRPSVIFKARMCGGRRIADRKNKLARSKRKRNVTCCRPCLALKKKGNRQWQQAMYVVLRDKKRMTKPMRRKQAKDSRRRRTWLEELMACNPKEEVLEETREGKWKKETIVRRLVQSLVTNPHVTSTLVSRLQNSHVRFEHACFNVMTVQASSKSGPTCLRSHPLLPVFNNRSIGRVLRSKQPRLSLHNLLRIGRKRCASGAKRSSRVPSGLLQFLEDR